MTRTEYDVVALGELLIDFTAQGAGADGYPLMAAHPGGAPANFLAAIARLGGRTALLSKVGADAFGTQLVFVTCGADGCEFASLRAQGHVDGLKGLTVTDTTGAGDIFGGCAVWRLLQSGKAPAALDEAELRGIAEFACRVAGRSTEKSGGISAITEMPDEVFMG